ncbi:MAG TPA: serine hydrolase domain-containing protein [Thermoanaerobaculia bacterium]|nr:serine hydrolase domain-containing protein [Thermoanaerobaculia bacterium]
MTERRVDALLSEGIERGFFAGAAAVVESEDGILLERYVGDARVEPASEKAAASRETLWDLASLTKPIAGAALALALRDAGLLALSDPLGRFGDVFKKTRFDGVDLRRLLTHTAGLVDWYPCYVRGEGRAAYRRTLAAIDPDGKPGSMVRYSCPGFLLLADIVETVAGETLDVSFRRRVAEPLGLSTDLLYLTPGATTARAAGGERDDATERRMTKERGLTYAGFRTGVVNGEPNDGNAYRRAGGVSLNAGLFGTARAVAAVGRAWLSRDPALLQESSFVEATADATTEFDEGRGLGWQLARTPESAGAGLSPKAFGHTGFTGGSLFVDPDATRVFVLLSNRVHPDARPVDMNAFRRRFHEAALAL